MGWPNVKRVGSLDKKSLTEQRRYELEQVILAPIRRDIPLRVMEMDDFVLYRAKLARCIASTRVTAGTIGLELQWNWRRKGWKGCPVCSTQRWQDSRRWGSWRKYRGLEVGVRVTHFHQSFSQTKVSLVINALCTMSLFAPDPHPEGWSPASREGPPF